jgi:hypothetical protein
MLRQSVKTFEIVPEISVVKKNMHQSISLFVVMLEQQNYNKLISANEF